MYQILTGYAYDSTIEGNIFQYVGTRTDSTAIVVTEHGPVSHTITIENNIVLPNGNSSSGSLAYTASNTTDPITVDQIIQNNTVAVGNLPAIYAGLTIGQKAGTLPSLSSNIFWQVGSPQPNTYALQNLDPNPVQIVTAADADYNGTYNPVDGSCRNVENRPC